jgi:hypothetical protein
VATIFAIKKPITIGNTKLLTSWGSFSNPMKEMVIKSMRATAVNDQ